MSEYNELEFYENKIIKSWKIIREIDRKKNKRFFECECLKCGRLYDVAISTLRNPDKGFCCQSCANSKSPIIKRSNETTKPRIKGIDITGQLFGSLVVLGKNPDSNKNKIEYFCLCECLTIKSIRKDKLLSGRIKSCGCRNYYRNSNNEPTKNKETIRKAINNKRVFERDSYICANCGIVSNNNDAHHIFDFDSFPSLRRNYFNLVTLCKTCHNNFHKIYPRKGTNTLDDLETFINKPYEYRIDLLAAYNKKEY